MSLLLWISRSSICSAEGFALLDISRKRDHKKILI